MAESRGGLPMDSREQLELSDLLNRVLDKGAVITGSVIISVADVDLVKVGLSIMITAVETEARRMPPPFAPHDAHVPVLPPRRGE